jgi:hypothetical protein
MGVATLGISIIFIIQTHKQFYLIFSFLIVLQSIGSLLMFEKDNAPHSLNVDVQEETKEVVSIKTNKNENKHPSLTVKDALKLKELYIIAFIFSFSSLTGSVFTANYKVVFLILFRD